MNWKKTLMYSSFAAGAVLFFTGRRSAGLAVAGLGVATFAAENPERFQKIWDRMPEYLDKGVKFVDMATTFLEPLSEREDEGHLDILVADSRRY